MNGIIRAARMTAILVLFYGLATVLGLLLFVAALRADLFGALSILFYRGIVDLAAVGVVLAGALALLVRRRGAGILSGRDAVAAAIVATALNLAAFTVGPVTTDRSVSVFLLSQFALRPAPITVDDMAAIFVRVYVCGWNQIERRFDEQVASGNLERTPEGYRLTAQGRSFVTTARLMAKVFGTDPRMVGMQPPVRVATGGDLPAGQDIAPTVAAPRPVCGEDTGPR